MKQAFTILIVLISLSGAAYPLYNYETIETPTTHIIPPKTYNVTFKMLPVGGMAFAANLSLFPRLMFGLSYSATQIVSYDNPVFSKYPGFLIKVLLVEEDDYTPQVAFGISSQGFGEFNTNRFTIKSKGIFCNTSKILYPPIGELLIGGGMNYSVFENVTEKMVDFFGQIEYYLNDNVGFLLEYSLGLDDNDDDGVYGRGVGYLNGGMRWIYEEKLAVEIDFIDLVKNNEEDRGIGRSVKISYTDFF